RLLQLFLYGPSGPCNLSRKLQPILSSIFQSSHTSLHSCAPFIGFNKGSAVIARIIFKTLMLAYKAKNGPAPPYLMAMVKSRAVPRALRASSTARLDPPSLRTHGRQASRLFSVLAPRWWNELPLGVRTVESLAVFKRRLKTHLFVMHLSMSTGLGLP
ncbi:hypothetical protein NFI96_018256, partial [Prochilodus magdalenae]